MKVLRVDGDFAVIDDGVVERQIRFSYKPVTVNELVEIIEFLSRSSIPITDYHIANSFMLLGIVRNGECNISDGKISYTEGHNPKAVPLFRMSSVDDGGVSLKKRKVIEKKVKATDKHNDKQGMFL